MGIKARKGRGSTVRQTTEFINVDLDLTGPADLAPLSTALKGVHAVHSTDEAPFFTILEVDDVGLDVGATMHRFLELIESLDSSGRRLWDQCSVRRFNIGIQSGLGPNSTLYSLPAPLLARVASVGAEVIITVYGTRR